MKIAIIAAHDEHLLIGKDGGIPWHFSDDLKHFKARTLGHPIVMGRKTYESIGSKPLPGRTNIVISRSHHFDNARVYNQLDKALVELSRENNEMAFIAGGAFLYKLTLDIADYLNITLIHHTYTGDTYFPEYRNQINEVWEETHREDFEDFSFIDYQRIT